MATDKPRLSVSMDEKTFEKVLAYKEEQGISTQSKAIIRLMEAGLEDLERELLGEASRYSKAAMALAKDYDTLDSFGKKQVRDVADNELARCADESRFLVETAPEEEPKIIPLYLFPAAAGYASPVFNEDYEDYELKPEDPQGAMFAVRLQGDSMEPDFPDGSIVFCNKDPMADGDIGIFSVDSGSVCKQYHKEGGVVYLFSLNRARQDADVVLFPSGNRPLSCQGRVITRKRYKVPGR